jgi:subtilase family serine protease
MPVLRRTPFLRVLAVGVAAVGTLTVAAVTGPVAGASTGAAGAGNSTATARGAAGPAFDCLTLAPPTCYSPRQFRTAYGIEPLTRRGITGRGETVVMPEFTATPGEAGVTDVRQDIARYDSVFGLPAANLRVITSLAPGASPFQAPGEYAGDVEILHAIAPQAAIRVILIPADVTFALGVRDFRAALRMAPSLGSVVSITQGGFNESCLTSAQVATIHSALQFDRARHVTVAVAAGDFGAEGQPCTTTPAPARAVVFPASDPLALAVGGTSLDASHRTGAYIGETVWNQPGSGIPGVVASGGGFSRDFARPAYQDGVPGIGARRGVPDVASDADPDTGIACVLVSGGQFGIFAGGGTSAGAPVWAGIVALADQYGGRHLGFINPAIYEIGRGAQYHHAFHDVTKGSNTVQVGSVTVKGFDAGPGWDPVTGWGSPNAQVLIPLLARHVAGLHHP